MFKLIELTCLNIFSKVEVQIKIQNLISWTYFLHQIIEFFEFTHFSKLLTCVGFEFEFLVDTGSNKVRLVTLVYRCREFGTKLSRLVFDYSGQKIA